MIRLFEKREATEQIINGNLETGDTTGWSGCGGISINNPHSGTYCWEITDDYPVFVQAFTSPILVDTIDSFTIWIRSTMPDYVNIQFLIGDEIYCYQFTDLDTEWKEYNLKSIMTSLGITSGTLYSIAFFGGKPSPIFGGEETHITTAFDDVSLMATIP